MPFELHVWGSIGELPSFDPDCLAAILYLQVAATPSDYVIVPSSNPLLSNDCMLISRPILWDNMLTDPSDRLPVVRVNRTIVASGIFDVLRFFQSEGFDLNSDLSPTQKAQNIALSTFISDNFTILSLYIQRLHILHFQEIFRPGLIQLIPFPLQYAAPMFLFTAAKRRIAHVHDLDSATSDSSFGRNSSVPGILFLKKQAIRYSDVQDTVPKTLVDKINKTAGGASEFSGVLRMLNLAGEVLASIESALSESEGPYLFGEKPKSADVLLLSHLLVETLPKYASPFVKDLIESRYSYIQKYLDENKDLVSINLEDVKVASVHPQDRLTIRNIIKKCTGY
ncbi:hypothetical protein POJ06DRAFT_250132 [Lipomyces tetrasporus]|uniref:Mitochondrial outer membrane transport complex Sam37/metaxin N-terminal domain-containing protein n=1 Tax=Lipomyces tetrasporus TaxID=54092 RepID=A0AAD7QTC7_9ASCO|nr:uncharacterized protein POJ06DRAFT_250132 [Lipomyces tetrasporus]KAJ8100995.1 hypothetical protein POJ06DRAFT_250132 [Lipomyces tetrasporus]